MNILFIENYRKYSTALNTHDAIKFMAIFVMIVDHIGMFFCPEALWFRAIGRLAFPIFAFLVGYAKPSRKYKDIYILAALMIGVDVILKEPVIPLNILSSMIVCRYFIAYIDARQHLLDKPILNLILPLTIWFYVSALCFDYGTLGFAIALCGYLTKNKMPHRPLLFLFAYVSFYITQAFGMEFSSMQNGFIGTSLAALFLYLYHFDFKTLPTLPYLQAPIMFIARNSLWLYFIHYVGFQLGVFLANAQ